jgi:hypothetical protein
MGSTDVLPALVEAAPDVSLLELLQNSNVGSGLQTAVPSRRGATTHALDEGGVQEKELVEKYRRMAEQVADGSPLSSIPLGAPGPSSPHTPSPSDLVIGPVLSASSRMGAAW